MSKICNSALQAHNEKFHIMKNSTFKENKLVFNQYRWKCTYCRNILRTEQVLKRTSKQFTQNYIQDTQLKENPALTMCFYVRPMFVLAKFKICPKICNTVASLKAHHEELSKPDTLQVWPMYPQLKYNPALIMCFHMCPTRNLAKCEIFRGKRKRMQQCFGSLGDFDIFNSSVSSIIFSGS